MNPLTRTVKGYPVWGWLVLLLVIVTTIYTLSAGVIPTRCGVQADCTQD